MNFNFNLYIEELASLVNIDSPSSYPKGNDQIAAFFHEKYQGLGWKVEAHRPHREIGNCLRATNGGGNNHDILILGHMDTVFPIGTVAQRPFVREGSKAFGPGVNDMKAGLLNIYYAVAWLEQENRLPPDSICVLLNSDEEIGSRYSRQLITRLAASSRHALVAEPGRPNGELVNQRKGVGSYRIEITGLAAHAGVEPEKGCSALVELARLITALHGLNDYAAGTTVNVGIAGGGTATNVVAEKAFAQIDVRVSDSRQAENIDQAIHALAAQPAMAGIHSQIEGGLSRPPMNPNQQTLELCRKIEVIAKELQIDIEWQSSGGGSDGNFTAAMGVPTIDALGPVGGNSHSKAEYLELNSIEPRIRLLAGIIDKIVND